MIRSRFALLLLAMVVTMVCGFSFQDEAADPAIPPEVWTMLLTYTGLAGVTAVAVEYLKKIVTKGWFDGKEQFSAFVIAPALGSAVKAFGFAYADIPWAAHALVCTFVGVVGAGWIHDKFIPVFAKLVIPRFKNKKKD